MHVDQTLLTTILRSLTRTMNAPVTHAFHQTRFFLSSGVTASDETTTTEAGIPCFVVIVVVVVVFVVVDLLTT